MGNLNLFSQDIARDPDRMNFLMDHYKAKFGNLDDFEFFYNQYITLPAFKACENIHEVAIRNAGQEPIVDNENEFIIDDPINDKIHWIMRIQTQWFLTQAFKAMKVDLEDPNVAVNALGKGTPGRIAKMWCGNDPEDTTELGSGRWNREPAISCFPNEDGENASVVTKQVDVVSCCSHHFLPFSTFDGGKAYIAYKPGKYVLGISKLQRYVSWASRRFWLQEDLTSYIGKTISRIAETPDVYVRLEGLVHGCEKFRGANAKNGSLTTEYRGGIFKSYTPQI